MTASFIGCGLAPRLNAAGRMREATLAVNLLLCEDPGEAEKLAAEICEINRERQSEENRIAADAQEMISRDPGFSVDRVLVLSDDHWRQGIIGIVASRLTENYGKPAILISFDGATRGFDSPDDLGKGSGRRVKVLNLVRALSACEDIPDDLRGHVPVGRRREALVRVGHVQHVVDGGSALLRRGLGRADVHAAIDLHGIHRDDFRVKRARQIDGSLCLA